MAQPAVHLKMPFTAFLADARAEWFKTTMYHVIDNGIHYGYDNADRAAALAYHQGLAGYVSTANIDGSNDLIVRSTDAAYVAGSSVVPASLWDAVAHGPNAAIAQDTLGINGGQEMGRVALGRDPAAGGVYQWEYTVYVGGTGGVPINIRPIFGMVDANRDCTTTNNTAPFGGGAHDWAFFMDNPAGINGSHLYHNGDTGTAWDGLIAGTAVFKIQNVYDAAAKSLKVYRAGVLKGTFAAGVGVDGTLMYPAFGSFSGAATGGQWDMATINTRGNFAFPIAGATPWNG